MYVCAFVAVVAKRCVVYLCTLDKFPKIKIRVGRSTNEYLLFGLKKKNNFLQVFIAFLNDVDDSKYTVEYAIV